MIEDLPTTSEHLKLLSKLVALVESEKTARFFLEPMGEWLALYDVSVPAEGEMLLYDRLSKFEALREYGLVFFDLGANRLNSAMLRRRLDVTPRAIEYCKAIDKPQGDLTFEHKDMPVTTVLFLAANPLDTTRLRLDQEVRAVDQVLRLAGFRDRFEFEKHLAVRVKDLQELLLRHKPDIVHFSGHGSTSSEMILENDHGNSQPVSARALSRLFSVLKDNVRCVVLNACYSESQARAIAEHIDCVIGMSRAIDDSTAISFSTAFYQALGYGKSVKTAFDLGCVQVDLENLGEQDAPRLLCTRADPSRVVFV